MAKQTTTKFADLTQIFTTNMAIRWRDLDAFNHVNNATYLTYLEEARLMWLKQVPGAWFHEHAMPVMAASEINYLKPITWPAQLQIKLACQRLGKSSLTLAHQIIDTDTANVLYSDGRVVVVWMDPATGKSVTVPEAIKNVLNHQG